MSGIKTEYSIKSDCRGMSASKIVKQILKDRGIHDANRFLNPTIEDMLPLNALKGINRAAKVVQNAISSKMLVGVLWDTDTDGATAGAIMSRYLQCFLPNVQTYINQGKMHGLVNQDLSQFEQLDLLIIVDSLDENIDQYAWLANMGVEVVILDHHVVKDNIPYDQYVKLVSSQIDYPNPALSGAGVTWKFCKYLDEILGVNYADDYMDLAACGIVADMCDLSENSMENRYIVKWGLNSLKNEALKAIIGGFKFNSTAVSFSVAPLINAANRTNNNNIIIDALMSDNKKEATRYVRLLKKCKDKQNKSIDSMIDNIKQQAENQISNKCMFLHIESAHEISGLIGNKLLPIYQRPLIVLRERQIKGEDYYVGSSRAVGVKDFREMCESTGLAQALGHELAFGIRIKKSDYDEFCSKIQKVLEPIEFKTQSNIDVLIKTSDLTLNLVQKIQELDEVSGTGFEPIVFKINSLRRYNIDSMSDGRHLVVKPCNHKWLAIKWNWTGSFEDMEDNATLSTPLTLTGTLDSGFIGRKFSYRIICNDITEL